jgi:nucleoside-diphosphate-sugar epimerase
VKIIELATLIFAQIGWNPREFNFDMSKPVGVFSRAADLSRSREVLGWEPSVSIQDGLRRTIDWYWKVKKVDEVTESLGLLLTER